MKWREFRTGATPVSGSETSFDPSNTIELPEVRENPSFSSYVLILSSYFLYLFLFLLHFFVYCISRNERLKSSKHDTDVELFKSPFKSFFSYESLLTFL